MCLAIPGEVIEIKNKNALIKILGVKRNVSVELVQEVKVGNYVLIHTGCAIEIIDKEEALKTLEVFKELEEYLDG